MKAFIVVLAVLTCAGCMTSNSVREVNSACAAGNIHAYRERDADRSLEFNCQRIGGRRHDTSI